MKAATIWPRISAASASAAPEGGFQVASAFRPRSALAAASSAKALVRGVVGPTALARISTTSMASARALSGCNARILSASSSTLPGSLLTWRAAMACSRASIFSAPERYLAAKASMAAARGPGSAMFSAA